MDAPKRGIHGWNGDKGWLQRDTKDFFEVLELFSHDCDDGYMTIYVCQKLTDYMPKRVNFAVCKWGLAKRSKEIKELGWERE